MFTLRYDLSKQRKNQNIRKKAHFLIKADTTSF